MAECDLCRLILSEMRDDRTPAGETRQCCCGRVVVAPEVVRPRAEQARRARHAEWRREMLRSGVRLFIRGRERKVSVVRVEHKYRSSMIEPKLNPKEFNRGWINEPELPAFVGSLEEAARIPGPGVFVEIGVKHAGSSLCVVQVLNKLQRSASFTAIDVDPQAENEFRTNVSKIKGTVRSRFILGSSFKVGREFSDPCSWVFVDGCHCRECTTADIEVWAPKVVKDGLILFHDCDYRVQFREKFTQKAAHEAKPVGVYEAMMSSERLRRDFYMIHYMEGAVDPKGQFWNGFSIWRRKP